ncbi:MAG: hypothetical protein ACRD1L_00880 [Terriglobales bacterium]
MDAFPKPARRTTRLFASQAEAAAAERQPWPALTPQQCLALVWPLTLEQYRLAGMVKDEPRLCLTVARVVRR